jgi:S-layer homology domain
MRFARLCCTRGLMALVGVLLLGGLGLAMWLWGPSVMARAEGAAVVGGTDGPTATPTPMCPLAWHVVNSPNPSATTNYLFSVAIVTSSDVWAVGKYNVGTNESWTLTMHWDGTQWALVSSPNRNSGTNFLLAVDAIATDDVWAVGYTHSSSAGWLTLTERWNGTLWSIVPSPNGNQIENYLEGVSAVSSDDVWAVGWYVADIGGQGYQRTLVEHWNGTQWSVVASPNLGTASSKLNDVSAISINDAWAVGYAEGIGTLTERWDGTQWNIVPSPNPPGSNAVGFQAVSATSPSDVWAVGKYGGGPSAASTLVEHWDGAQWMIISSPNAGTGTNWLFDASGTSLTDAWAVGYYCCGNEGLITLIEHWDGVQWSIVQSPNPTRINNYLFGVAASSPSDVWAVGYFQGSGTPQLTLVEQTSRVCAAPSLTPTQTPTTGIPTQPPTPTNTFTATGTAIMSVTPTRTSTNIPTLQASTTLTATMTTSTPTPCSPGAFLDVFPTDYFYQAVRDLSIRGAISGYADCTFRPYNLTTRGQLTKIVVLAEQFAIYTPPVPTFIDVPAAHTFYSYIETAYHQGIISGYSCGAGCLEFRPGDSITRGQLCKVIVLAEGWAIYTPATPTFRDVPSIDAFYAYIETSAHVGIISGYSCGTGCLEFRPGNNATRGQICKIVYGAITLPGEK